MIRVPCPSCGPTYVPDASVKVYIGPGGGSYLFTCHGTRYYRHCSLRIARLLEGYARVVYVDPEAAEGPPIDHDDLLDLLVGFNTPGWIDELLST